MPHCMAFIPCRTAPCPLKPCGHVPAVIFTAMLSYASFHAAQHPVPTTHVPAVIFIKNMCIFAIFTFMLSLQAILDGGFWLPSSSENCNSAGSSRCGASNAMSRAMQARLRALQRDAEEVLEELRWRSRLFGRAVHRGLRVVRHAASRAVFAMCCCGQFAEVRVRRVCLGGMFLGMVRAWVRSYFIRVCLHLYMCVWWRS